MSGEKERPDQIITSLNNCKFLISQEQAILVYPGCYAEFDLIAWIYINLGKYHQPVYLQCMGKPAYNEQNTKSKYLVLGTLQNFS